MHRNVVGGPLGMLRRRGEAEGILGARGESLWRKASAGDLHRPRSTGGAGEHVAQRGQTAPSDMGSPVAGSGLPA